jgi:hypothetical protein
MLPRVQAHIGDHLGTRVQHIRTRQFGQHDASQGLTNAADAEQQIAFPPQDGIIVDCLCDGLVDSTLRTTIECFDPTRATTPPPPGRAAGELAPCPDYSR